jgi:hypothetical protein
LTILSSTGRQAKGLRHSNRGQRPRSGILLEPLRSGRALQLFPFALSVSRHAWLCVSVAKNPELQNEPIFPFKVPQGHSRLFKTTQAYSRVFGKKYFIYIPQPKSVRVVPSLSKAFLEKKKIVYFYESSNLPADFKRLQPIVT